MNDVLWARVDAAGNITRGSGASTAIREDGVGYSVQFDRDVSSAGWLATIESTTAGLSGVPPRLCITVRLLDEGSQEGRRTLYVVIADQEGTFVHVPFHVAAVCAASPSRPPIHIPK